MTPSIEATQSAFYAPKSVRSPGADPGALRPDSETVDGGSEFNLFGKDGLDFSDVLDIVNPLQHIPFVSTMYRELTGDALEPGPRLMGSALFFGPLGLAGAVANVAVEFNTGKDMGAHVASWFEGTEPDNEAVAQNGSIRNDNEMFEDPVVAWARREQGLNSAANASPDMKANARQADEPLTDINLPDANMFVGGDEKWAGLANTPVLTADLRSAANAYRAAAGLGLPA